MKRKLLIAVVFIISSAAVAQSHKVVLETAQNERLEYLFSENPRIEHQDSLIVLTTNSTTVKFNTVDVAKVYLSSITTSIVSLRETAKKVSFVNDGIRLMNFTPRTAVSLYNVSGQLLQRLTVHDDGSLVIPLNQQASGIYVVKTQYQSFKVTKK